jgi:outer membrane immunogenic protein
MKRLLLASAALFSFVAIASVIAANAQATSQGASKKAPEPAQSWNGYYAGIHLGAAFPHLHLNDIGDGSRSFANAGTAGQGFDASGGGVAFGGAQVGYDFQKDSLVYGLQGDIGWMNLHANKVDPGSTDSQTKVGLNRGMYQNATGRFGKAAGSALFYVKGGLALYDGKESFVTNGSGATHSDTDVFPGWVAGGGAEIHLGSNWSGSVEYLHQGFAYRTFNVVTGTGSFPFEEQLSTDSVSLGFNYRFGGGAAKATAKH